MIEDIVKVIVDRPLGSQHPQYKETYYPINYGLLKASWRKMKKNKMLIF